MKVNPYWQYFRFLYSHWNLRLALFTIYHEIRGEKKYRIHSTGYNDLKLLSINSSHLPNAFIYQPANYFMIEKAFSFLRTLHPDGTIVDFGCGKGRIMAVAASYGFKIIRGIEFAKELCVDAKKNTDRIQPDFPDTHFEIFHQDAIQYSIQPTDDIFIFFNPFDEVVMLPVIRNILRSFKENSRKILIVYFNPTEKEIFLSAGFHEIWYYPKMTYLDFSILMLKSNEEED